MEKQRPISRTHPGECEIKSPNKGNVRPRRGVILPPEHGSWGMIGEPLVLGLLLFPSLVSICIAVLSFSLFLLRVPLLRVLKGRRMPQVDPYRKVVKWFTLCAGTVALLSLSGSLALSEGQEWLWPFGVAAPMVLWALKAQNRGRTRHLLPELLAGVAIGASLSAIFLANGETLSGSFAIWGLLACKTISCIYFVRCQIRRFHQRPSGRAVMLGVHFLLSLLVGLLVLEAWLPERALWVMPLLGIRALYFSCRPVRSAKQVGWIEMGVSLLFVFSISF